MSGPAAPSNEFEHKRWERAYEAGDDLVPRTYRRYEEICELLSTSCSGPMRWQKASSGPEPLRAASTVTKSLAPRW